MGGDRDERRAADQQLRECVAQVQNKALGALMYDGVRAGGGPWWPTSYRWGYGWPYGRGYRELNDEEQHMADEVLAASEPSVEGAEPD